ncbi:MAG TPA: hypothetical protein DIU20_14525 [Cryomorphaceae bacterium]|nr:hypothetical protein [Cryomorphaceae bacterium]
MNDSRDTSGLPVFQTSFNLPDIINVDKIETTYKDGLLSLESTKKRKLEKTVEQKLVLLNLFNYERLQLKGSA